jgi:CheY-like chemotaxis protein
MVTAAAAEGKAGRLPISHKPKVLVVDDDAAVRRLLDLGLRYHGFQVCIAANGPEAIELYENHSDSIDLVLLDVKMPGLDGPGTLRALAQVNPQVRSAFMSGYAGHYSEDELLRRGARYVFRKPFDLAELADRLRQIIEN